MKTISGHFDGKVIILDEPATLKANTKVKILAPADNEAGLVDDCAALSAETFRKIWDNPLDADYDRL